jgi:hypothetical protein
VVIGQTFATQVTETAIDIAGYNKVPPTSVTISIAVDGNVIVFYYTVTNSGVTISIQKTVDGVAFNMWATGYSGNIAELLSGVSFNLYKVNADGTINYANVVATGTLKANGMIEFENTLLSAGRYAVVEILTGKAASVFEQVEPLFIQIDASGRLIGGTNFDSNAKYWSTDSFYNSRGTANLAITYVVSTSTIVNPWFNDFETRLYNPVTGLFGKSYSSFCGYYNSGKLGGETYNGPTFVYMDKTATFAALKPGVKGDVIAAFNYIYDTWGSLDQWPNAAGTSTPSESTKFIANIVVWLLLDDGITSAKSDFAYINTCVDEVLANYKGYIGSGTITDIVFLADENYPTNLAYCQPQIVPIFGEPVFNNNEQQYNGLSLAKTVDGVAFDAWATGYTGNIDELLLGISFKLYQVNTDGTINYDTTIANGILDKNTGIIKFNNKQPLVGKYAVVETLTGKAAEVFAASDPLYICIYADGEVVEDIDYNAEYFVRWQWFNSYGRVGLTGVSGENYYITEVWDIETRTSLGADYNSYKSFCADGTSRTFAETNSYKVGQLEQETYDNILAALNYINNKYGSIYSWQGNDLTSPITVTDSTRVLSQIIVWMMIHDDDDALQNIRVSQTGYDTEAFALAVHDVLDNYTGSTGAIKDIVYLVGFDFPNDIIQSQPQIVALFSNPTFDNTAINN